MSVTAFPDVAPPEVLPTEEFGTDTDDRPKVLPPYVVIILNDDYHTFGFVVSILVKVLRCKQEQAVQWAVEAHETGRAVVWHGSKEVAELKKEQLETFREHRPDTNKDIGPLGVEIEPAYG